MKEELARQASRILSEIVIEEQRLSDITKMKENLISENGFLTILCIIKENSDLFAPTLKKYITEILDKAIGEKKELIDRMKKMLEKL